MAGLTPDTPTPESLTVHGASRVLEVAYSDGASFRIPFELLRVYSPSAEVQGHGPGQEVLQTGKREVGITAIEPVGNYAIKPFFSDGHESGLYTWEYLYELGRLQDEFWAQYLDRLQESGMDRDTPMPGKASGGGHGCGSHRRRAWLLRVPRRAPCATFRTFAQHRVIEGGAIFKIA
jgi:DUF971 family protein